MLPQCSRPAKASAAFAVRGNGKREAVEGRWCVCACVVVGGDVALGLVRGGEGDVGEVG